jgi:hypothetical protein
VNGAVIRRTSWRSLGTFKQSSAVADAEDILDMTVLLLCVFAFQFCFLMTMKQAVD